MRKLFGIGALAVTVALAAPTIAQASPQWYEGSTLLGATHKTVTTSGKLKLVTTQFKTITCKVKDSEEIWNPASGGQGEDTLTAFTLEKCKAPRAKCKPVHVTYEPVPEHTFLQESSGRIYDVLGSPTLTVSCGTIVEKYHDANGGLLPYVESGALNFDTSQTAANQFENSSHELLTLEGVDKFTPATITAK